MGVKGVSTNFSMFVKYVEKDSLSKTGSVSVKREKS